MILASRGHRNGSKFSDDTVYMNADADGKFDILDMHNFT